MKLVIIGGVAAGATAAARARRLDESAEITIFERGPYVSFANCGLPYHIGGVIPERDSLLLFEPAFFKARFNIDVKIEHEVTRINPTAQTLTVLDKKTNESFEQAYDKLIIATGASPAAPPIQGLPSPLVTQLWTIPDMDRIIQALENKKDVTVVGAGFVGLEVAENLAHKGYTVRVVEFADQILPPFDKEMTAPLCRELRAHQIELRLGVGVKALREENAKVLLTLSDESTIETEYVILSTGVRPNSAIAQEAGLTLGPRGGIVTNAYMQTSKPLIYAAGDVCEIAEPIRGGRTQIPLAAPANKQARIAADNAVADLKHVYNGALGSSVLKVFDFTAASTGLNEKTLKRDGVPYSKIYTHSFNHVSYYPGAKMVHAKVLFDPITGVIFGAQMVGKEGVARRIDVVATAIAGNLTIDALAQLDLCYAPPFGGAKDAVTILGTVGENVRAGLEKLVYAEDLTENDCILDIRENEERLGGTIAHAISIPLDELRARHTELPKNQRIVVYCRVGQRGHVAQRLLASLGYDAYNLSGGYLTYQMVFPPDDKTPPAPKKAQIRVQTIAKKPDVTGLLLDVRGMPCPGPLMTLKKALDAGKTDALFELLFEEQGFAHDLEAFCQATGNTLERTDKRGSDYHAFVRKTSVTHTEGAPLSCGVDMTLKPGAKRVAMVLFSGDFDKAMAALIMAGGYASMGADVTIFATFWGLNLFRKSDVVLTGKGGIAKMFEMMMPRGARALRLSKMNFGGAGTWLMKQVMKKQNVKDLPELLEQARAMGVHLMACEMSMNVMGLRREELLDDLKLVGVGSFAALSTASDVTLFI